MRIRAKLGIAVLAILLAMTQIAYAIPDGAVVNAGTPVTREFAAAAIVGTLSGNLTNLTLATETQTIAWQGFYGNVSGNITLEDATGDTLYSWPNAANGTILASRDSAVNFTTIAAQNNCSIDESLTGTNSDRVNATFRPSNNTVFTIGTTTIAAGTACATHTYVNSMAQNTAFEEIILTDDGGATSIYATRIENGVTGFNGEANDFQMIVPDFSNSTTSTYYFYAELQ